LEKQKMNKNTKKLVVGGVVAVGLPLTAAALIIGAGVAKADTSDMTSRQVMYATNHGDAVCAVFKKYPTAGGLFGLSEAVAEDGGFTAYQSGEIIGYSVGIDCPSELPALLRAADSVLGSSGGSPVSMSVVSFDQRGGKH
jgi:hypothetical protein